MNSKKWKKQLLAVLMLAMVMLGAPMAVQGAQANVPKTGDVSIVSIFIIAAICLAIILVAVILLVKNNRKDKNENKEENKEENKGNGDNSQ